MDPVRQTYDFIADKLREKYERFKDTPPPLRFRASEAGDCGKKIWYRLMGTMPDKQRGPFVELITRDGDLLHDEVRRLMRDAGVELYDLTFTEHDAVIEDNYATRHVEHNGEKFDVSFRADGGVVIDGKRYTLEIKTIDGFSYNYMEQAYKRGGWERLLRYMRGFGKDKEDGKFNLGEKYDKFFAQATVTGALSKPPADGYYIVVKNRSLGQFGFDGQNDGLTLPFDQELYTKILNKFAYITRAVHEGVPPLQDYTKDSKPCRVCDFRERCWAKEEL